MDPSRLIITELDDNWCNSYNSKNRIHFTASMQAYLQRPLTGLQEILKNNLSRE